jgi:hypothetical protein
MYFIHFILVGEDILGSYELLSNVMLFFCDHRFLVLFFFLTKERVMNPANSSLVNELILMGLTDQNDLQVPLFFLFLMIYMVTAFGNIGLIILIVLNSHLHTPMYFFLMNLSFIDLCYSSVITPKMLKEECYLLHGMYDPVLLFLLFCNF